MILCTKKESNIEKSREKYSCSQQLLKENDDSLLIFSVRWLTHFFSEDFKEIFQFWKIGPDDDAAAGKVENFCAAIPKERSFSAETLLCLKLVFSSNFSQFGLDLQFSSFIVLLIICYYLLKYLTHCGRRSSGLSTKFEGRFFIEKIFEIKWNLEVT